MIFEICADSLDAVKLAEKYKVKRVELCSALSVGGLTPSVGLIEECCSVGDVEVHVMIRHKEGNFIYSPEDIQIMENDIIASADAGAKGVVFGCLDSQNEVDTKQNKLLFKLAKSMDLEVTFHRAFDFCSDYSKSLEELIEIGFNRILSSGQESTAEKGISKLKAMTEQAKGRIQIMAGSGVNEKNAKQIANNGVHSLHFTIQHKTEQESDLGMGFESKMNEAKLRSIIDLFK